MKWLLILLSGVILNAAPPVTSFSISPQQVATNTSTTTATYTCTGASASIIDNQGNVLSVSTGTNQTQVLTPGVTKEYFLFCPSSTSSDGLGSDYITRGTGQFDPNAYPWTTQPNHPEGPAAWVPVWVGAGTLSITVSGNGQSGEKTGVISSTMPPGKPVEFIINVPSANCDDGSGHNAWVVGGAGCTGLGGHENPYNEMIGRWLCTGTNNIPGSSPAQVLTKYVDITPAFLTLMNGGINDWALRFRWPYADSVTCNNGFIGFGTNYSVLPNETFTITANGQSPLNSLVNSTNPFFTTESGSVNPFAFIAVTDVATGYQGFNLGGPGVTSNASGTQDWAGQDKSFARLRSYTEPGIINTVALSYSNGCVNSNNSNTTPGSCIVGTAFPSAPWVMTYASGGSVVPSLEQAAANIRNFANQGIHIHIGLNPLCNNGASGGRLWLLVASNDCNVLTTPLQTIGAMLATKQTLDLFSPFVDIVDSVTPHADAQHLIYGNANYYNTMGTYIRQWGVLVSSNTSPICASGCPFTSGNANEDIFGIYASYLSAVQNPSTAILGTASPPAGIAGQMATQPTGPSATGLNIGDEGGEFSPISPSDHDGNSVAGANERHALEPYFYHMGYGYMQSWDCGALLVGGTNITPVNAGAETNTFCGNEEMVQNATYNNVWDDIDLGVIKISSTASATGVTIDNYVWSDSSDVIAFIHSQGTTSVGGNVNFNVPFAATGQWYDIKSGCPVGSATVVSAPGVQNVPFPTLGAQTLCGLSANIQALVLRLRPTTSTNPTIDTFALPHGLAGAAWNNGVSYSITAVGGTAPYTYKIVSGNLPPGLTMTSGGAISGTISSDASGPKTPDTYYFQIQATDNGGLTSAVKHFMLVVNAGIGFDMDGSTSYLHTNVVSTGSVRSWMPLFGGLPYSNCSTTGAFTNTGLVFNGHLGGVTGTPGATVGATDNVTVTCTDALGNSTPTITYTQQLINTGVPYISWSSGNVGTPSTINIQLTQNAVFNSTALFTKFNTGVANAGKATWAVTSGTLPTGVNLQACFQNTDAAHCTGAMATAGTTPGLFQGTPTTTQSSSPVGAAYTDGVGTSNSITFNFSVVAKASVSVTTLPTLLANTPYKAKIGISNGTVPVCRVSFNSYLPTGWFLAPNSCYLYGPPTGSPATFTFNLDVTDKWGANTASIAMTVPVTGSTSNNSLSGSIKLTGKGKLQ